MERGRKGGRDGGREMTERRGKDFTDLRRCLVMSSSLVHSGSSAFGRNLSPMNLSTDSCVVRPSARAVRSMDDTQL